MNFLPRRYGRSLLAFAAVFSTIALLTTAAEAAGKRYALIVGVKTYRPNQPLPKLANPENDANDLATVLRAAGYDVTLMTQSESRLDGKEALTPAAPYIRDQIDVIVNNPYLTKDDLILVVMTGHGVQYPLEPGSTKIGKSYFCPADAEVLKLKSAKDVTDRNNLLDLSELYSKIEASKAGAKLLIVDACRNDPNVPVFDKAADTILLPVPPPPGGMAAMFSCSANERSIDDPDLKHGVFLHNIISGLKGDADSGTAKRPADGEITLSELHEFASRETFEFVRKKYNGYKQSPEMRGEFRVSMPLLTLSATTSRPKLTNVPKSGGSLDRKSANEKKPPMRPKVATAPVDGNTFAGKTEGEAKEIARGIAFRWCPPGSFTMGSPASETGRGDNEDQVQVTLSKGFWLGETEVTQEQWESLMNSTRWKGQFHVQEGGKNAASYISHDDANQFCIRLTAQEERAERLPTGWKYVLPTEAQWEYACRAGKKSAYHFGDDPSQLGDFEWYEENARDIGDGYPQQVGQKTANPWGLCDMHGNVLEWCSDWYGGKLRGGRDPSGPSTGTARVFRGGSWSSEASFSRAAIRSWISPELRNNNLGFRIAIVNFSK